MPELKVLLSGLGIPESPRWHEGRLWFCNWIDRQVVAVDLDGEAEVMLTRDPASHPMGYSIDWLPDGRLLTTGAKLERQEPDGSMALHADQRANEIVVDRDASRSPQGTSCSVRVTVPVTSSSGSGRSTAWTSPRRQPIAYDESVG